MKKYSEEEMSPHQSSRKKKLVQWNNLKRCKDGLLYENDQGQVTDKDGNVLQEYDWVIRNDYSTLAMMDGDTYVTLDHFWIDENGMITYDEEVEFTEPEPVNPNRKCLS